MRNVELLNIYQFMHTQQVLEHFENPRNIGTVADADGIATIGSSASGEMLKFSIKISNNTVVDAKFRAFGCPTAIACGSVLTEMVTGKQVSDVEEITAIDISDALGSLPKDKQRYAEYAEQAIKEALDNSKSI